MKTIRKMITVHIHVIKLVVKTNRLCLLIGLKQGAGVPKADVLNRILIPRDHLGRQISERRVSGLLNCVQLVCFTREANVMVQIGNLKT